jgi:acyl-coenzyme A synthetase/AMP-(fatty) acid ligase
MSVPRTAIERSSGQDTQTAMPQRVPLLRHRRLDAPIAFDSGRAINVGEFLRDVAWLAQRLPESDYVLNFCSDRYRFTVGLAAALTRRQLSLLPPNQTPELVKQLQDEYPGLYSLVDGPSKHTGLTALRYSGADDTTPAAAELPSFPERQIAALVFTSGSTGHPVAHAKTWGALTRGAAAQAERLGIQAQSGLAIVGTVPPQHMYGLESTLLLALHNGLAMHAGRPFYPADIRAALEQVPAPRMLVTTPVHLRALIEAETELPPLEILLCATAPLAAELAATAEARFGAPVLEIYGCTEAGQVATRRTVEGQNWRTFRDVQIRCDQRGVFALGGHVEQEGKLNDLLDLIDAETFVLHGRSADLVNIAGKRTSLSHLNYQLSTIDGVRDGVFFMPDETPRGVTRLAAFVVAPGLKQDSVLAALRRRIDSAFMPRPLYLVDALPRNATGKLPREALLQLLAGLAK